MKSFDEIIKELPRLKVESRGPLTAEERESTDTVFRVHTYGDLARGAQEVLKRRNPSSESNTSLTELAKRS